MTGSPEGAPEGVTPELLAELARYAGLPMSAEHARELAPLLAGPLGALRALRPDGYDDLPPAAVYRVPREP